MIYNQNGSKTKNKCAIENYMHGWSLSTGTSVGPLGINFVWGGFPGIGNGDAGLQFDEGVQVQLPFTPIVSYDSGPSC